VIDDQKRIRLTDAEVTLMNNALEGASLSVLDVAVRIGKGEVVPDEDAQTLADALCDVMLGKEYDPDQGLTLQGAAIRDVIATVHQMSEHYYD
jgi:hypothetical protein